MLWNVSFHPPSPLACSHSAFESILPSYISFSPFFTHPCFYHSLSLSLFLSEWAALRLLGLAEVYQKHVWRVGGGWWEVLRQAAHNHFPPKSQSQWGRKKKKTSQWVQRQKLIGFLQDIIFHWMDKQEKTSHPKPLSVKYRSQSENWISQPPSPLCSQSSPLRLFLLWFCCSSVWPCLSLTDDHIRDVTCLDFGLSDVIMDEDT